MKYRCPVCRRTVKIASMGKFHEKTFFPFCSTRCKLADLGAWLDANYRITSNLPPELPEETADTPSENHSDKHDNRE